MRYFLFLEKSGIHASIFDLMALAVPWKFTARVSIEL
jgi:hypothetical protein